MLKTIRLILISFLLILLIYFTWTNFVPTGVLKIEKKIGKQSPYFSDFYPSVRIKEVEQEKTTGSEKIYFRRMIIDPVYFDLLMPRQFEKAKIKIKYQNPDQPLFQIGLKRIDRAWSFDFKELSSKGEDWTIGEVEFTLYPFLIDDRTLHFVLSSPDLDINLNEIKISDIEVTLEREPWTWGNFWERMIKWLHGFMAKWLY